MDLPIISTKDKCRDVISAIPVYVWSALPDGTVDFVNPQWERYTGLPSTAALGWDWQQVIHDEDVERFKSAWRASLLSLQPLEQEIRVLGKNGSHRWWLIRCTPAFNDQRAILKWYGAGFDIDDLKRTQEELRRQDEIVRDQIEQELRDTIDAIPVLCGTLTSDGNVEFFNRRTLEYYGLRSEEMIGFNWKDVVHPDDLPRLVAAHLESLPAGRPLDIETRCRRADGEYRWLIHRMVPRFNESGQIVKWYGTSFDIEDRKRAEEAVLEQRVSERTRIARELHDTLLQDFQAMLLMFGAAANLLEGGPVRDRLEQALKKADRALSEGRDAIQGLRLLADGTGDLVTALRTLGEDLAASLGDDEAPIFHVTISGPTLCLRPSVRHEVFGIASEAIRNAFRHSRAKKIEVHFVYSAEEFTLAVIDNGIGIAPHVLSGGRGEGHFGLAGMRERARIASGQLVSSSELSLGTNISLRIPGRAAYDA
jgi:PAS domain S-box-containing protein